MIQWQCEPPLTILRSKSWIANVVTKHRNTSSDCLLPPSIPPLGRLGALLETRTGSLHWHRATNTVPRGRCPCAFSVSYNHDASANGDALFSYAVEITTALQRLALENLRLWCIDPFQPLWQHCIIPCPPLGNKQMVPLYCSTLYNPKLHSHVSNDNLKIFVLNMWSSIIGQGGTGGKEDGKKQKVYVDVDVFVLMLRGT